MLQGTFVSRATSSITAPAAPNVAASMCRASTRREARNDSIIGSSPSYSSVVNSPTSIVEGRSGFDMKSPSSVLVPPTSPASSMAVLSIAFPALDIHRRFPHRSRSMTPLPSSAAGPYGVRDIRSLYPAVTENHLRYLEKWGLVRQAGGQRTDREYTFADLQTIKHVAGELERGTTLKVILRALAAEREGQLVLDFHARSE